MIGKRDEKRFSAPPLEERDVSGDVVFRFSLNCPPSPIDPERALEDFFRARIQDLLRIVGITCKGKRLFVDGFHFLNDPEVILPLWPGAETAAGTSSKDEIRDNKEG